MTKQTLDPGWAPEQAKQFGYDAIESKGRRKPTLSQTKAEGKLLDPYNRQKLAATTRDLVRNMAIAKWMICQHLNYVSIFDFQATTPDKEFNRYLADFVAELGSAERFDASGRHRMDHFFRMAEARRIIDGDLGILKLADGTIQAIEGDRVRNPDGVRNFGKNNQQPTARGQWINGVRVNGAGRALSYCLWNRNQGGASWVSPRDVASSRLWLYGYFDSSFRFDQVRGISPLASATNSLRDVYEAGTYAILKAKSQSMFAMVFARAAEEAPGDITGGVAADEQEDKSGYDVDMGAGPIQLDLDPGDTASFLESKSPSNEFRQYMDHTIQASLKALNLDATFYDASKATWHGARSAQLHYERGCVDARNDQQELRNRWTAWRLTLAAIDGTLRLPAGWTVQDIRWEWVHRGQPWWRPDQEIRGDVEAIAAGFSNPYRVCRERGQGSFEDNVDQTLRATKYARERGLAELGEPLVMNFEPKPEPAPFNPGPPEE